MVSAAKRQRDEAFGRRVRWGLKDWTTSRVWLGSKQFPKETYELWKGQEESKSFCVGREWRGGAEIAEEKEETENRPEAERIRRQESEREGDKWSLDKVNKRKKFVNFQNP